MKLVRECWCNMAIPTLKYEVKISETWTDLTSYVTSMASCEYGIMGNKPLHLVASTGTFKFTLNNFENQFSPTSTTPFPGWRNGLEFRFRVYFEGDYFTKFYGRINDIRVDTRNRLANVTCVDWFYHAGTFPIRLPTLQFNYGMVSTIGFILDEMPIEPLHFSYYSAADNFNTIFDTVRKTTDALSEIQKVAQSEMGHVYIKRDKEDGETLVAEGRNNPRVAGAAPKKISYIFGSLVTPEGKFLTTVEGEKIACQNSTDTIDNEMYDDDIDYGSNVLNSVVVRAYPRTVGTTYEYLYKLGSPLKLEAGEIKTIFGNYTDPNNAANRVAGRDMQFPVPDVDYKMNSQSNGLGTNLTGSMGLTTDFGADGVQFTIRNFHSGVAYVTTLQAKGKGIFFYGTNDYIVQDTTSMLNHGLSEFSIDMKYQDSLDSPSKLADIILNQNKDPRVIINSITMLANTNSKLMNTFMYYDIGDFVHIKNDKAGVDANYYIQGIKFTVDQRKRISFTWIVKEPTIYGV